MDPRILDNLRSKFNQAVQRVQTLPDQVRAARQLTEQHVTPQIQKHSQNFVNNIPEAVYRQAMPMLPPQISRQVMSFGAQGIADLPASYLRGAEYALNPTRRREVSQMDLMGKVGAIGDVSNLVPMGTLAKGAGRLVGGVDLAQAGLGQMGKIKLGPSQKLIQTAGKLKVKQAITKGVTKSLQPLIEEAGIYDTKQFANKDLSFYRNPEKASNMGDRFGQNVEPSGKYINLLEQGQSPTTIPKGFEQGTVNFKNPLVMDWGGGYDKSSGWKNVISQKYGGLTGKDLSNAIARDGYDGIITIDKGIPQEVVSLQPRLSQPTGGVDPLKLASQSRDEAAAIQADFMAGKITQPQRDSLMQVALDKSNVSTQPTGGVTQKLGQIAGIPQGKGQQQLPGGMASADNLLSSPQLASSVALQQPGKTGLRVRPQDMSSQSDDILESGYSEIGSLAQKPKKTLTQHFDEFYTNWVDKFNPIVKAAESAEGALKAKGAQLMPAHNPRYTLKRFLGMGGIAEHRYEKELKPILSKLDEFQIPQKDIDLYLKARRDINLGGRGIKGSDSNLGIQRAGLMESKHGSNLQAVADQLYEYQKKGFQELSQAGFMDPATSNAIMTANADYVPFQRVMDKLDDYLGIPSRSVQQSANPVKSIKGSDKQIYSPVESIIANTYKQRAAIEKNNVVKSIVGLTKVMPELGFYPTSNSGSSTISVWESGQKVHYEVGEDIAKAVKGLSEENMHSFLKLLEIPASLLRQGATGRNPEFMLPNIVRDQFDAAMNSKYGYVPFVDWAKGLSHLVKKDEVYEAWVNSGAAQILSSMSGRQGIHDALMSKTAQKKLTRKLFGWMGEGLDTLGKYSENPTRIGLFNKAYQNTGNPLIGAMESREGTLDFARMGAKMKVANSIIPFLNVGLQGFDKMIRTAKDNPFKFALKMATYGTMPAVATTLYNTQFFPEEFAEIPQFVKDDNFVIVRGRSDTGTVQYMTIPKGNIIKYITNPVENFISYAAGTNSQSLSEMATLFISSGLPLLGEGQSIQEVATKTIGANLPQAIKPLTENLMNRSFYKYDTKDEQAKDIVPYYLNSKPAGERAYEFTPQAYQFIGKALNVSPLQVKNLLEGYLAGYVKIPVNIIESLNNINEGKDVNQNQIPILRRFVQETYPTSASEVSDSDLDLYGGPEPEKNAAGSDILSKASAAEENKGKKTPDQMIKDMLSDGRISALEKKQASSAIHLIKQEETAVYDSKLSDEEKDKELSRLGELKKRLQESDNKSKKQTYLNIKLTGDPDMDKLIASKQVGEITTEINNTVEAFTKGEISLEKANETIAGYKALQAELKKVGKGKKPKKLSIRMGKAPSFKYSKFKKIKVRKVKLGKFRLGKDVTQNLDKSAV